MEGELCPLDLEQTLPSRFECDLDFCLLKMQLRALSSQSSTEKNLNIIIWRIMCNESTEFIANTVSM